MKNSVLIFLSFIVFYSCSNKTEQKQKIEIENEIKIDNISDTIIGKKNVINEIAGSAYRKRATEYFVVVKKDTSGFRPIFTESKENGRIAISQNLPYSNETETYFQRLSELKLILPKAEKEFNFDSLSSMSIGRLILTGDLAIIITEEYKNKFGENEKIVTADYNEISDFLLESRLTKDLNELFEAYSKSVEKINIEKAFFTKRDQLLKFSSVSKDTMDVPNKILDCIIWVEFNLD